MMETTEASNPTTRSRTAVILADDEEDFMFHINHDMLIVSAIQDTDNDPKLLIGVLSCSDRPLW